MELLPSLIYLKKISGDLLQEKKKNIYESQPLFVTILPPLGLFFVILLLLP